MSSVFLSHSSKDHRFVHRLGGDLRVEGITVWIDESEIRVGDSFIRKIQEAMSTLDFIGIILSPDSVASNWVQLELNAAIAFQQDTKSIVRDNVNVKILPILYRDCDIPLFLREIRYADFRNCDKDDDVYRAALNELLNTLSPIPDPPGSLKEEIALLADKAWRYRVNKYRDHPNWRDGITIFDCGHCRTPSQKSIERTSSRGGFGTLTYSYIVTCLSCGHRWSAHFETEPGAEPPDGW